MATALEFIGGGSFGFEATTEIVRLRAGLIVDPYDPESTVSDWGSPDELTLSGYFSSLSSTEQDGEAREQVSTKKLLVLDDPGADVKRGDRIASAGKTWTVEGFPRDDKNPFTGWQPTLVVELQEVVG